MTFWQRIKEKAVWWILGCSVVLRLLYLSLDYPLWWDSHVYVSIGKFIFSGGEIGIWESFRPLLHPLLLGAVWKAGLDPVFFGKLFDLLFSLLAIYLVYRLAEQIYGKPVAALSSLLFSITPLLVMLTGLILTEPLALVLGLAGLLLLTGKEKAFKLFFSGLLLSLSFMTRFPQGIWFGPVALVLLFRREEAARGMRETLKRKAKNILGLFLGFLLPLIPYLYFNYRAYGDPLYPFIAGSWIVTTATWLYGSGWSYYFTAFFLSNPLYLLAFPYLYFFFRKGDWQQWRRWIVFLIPLVSFLYFLTVPRKEPRYLLTSLPLLAMMAAVILVQLYRRLERQAKPFLKPRAFAFLCLILALAPLPSGLHFFRPPTFEQEILQVIEEYQVTGVIVASDPSLVSFLDHHLVTLDGTEFALRIYQQQKGKYQLLFINDCDLPCPPQDPACVQSRQDFLSLVALENKEIFKKEANGCTYTMHLPNGAIPNTGAGEAER